MDFLYFIKSPIHSTFAEFFLERKNGTSAHISFHILTNSFPDKLISQWEFKYFKTLAASLLHHHNHA